MFELYKELVHILKKKKQTNNKQTNKQMTITKRKYVTVIPWVVCLHVEIIHEL